MGYEGLDFTYELRTPNPLDMSSDTYTGSLTYTVGPLGDFDMGDVMVPDDAALTLNFNLEVTHVLKVEIPPGGTQIVLEPQGGWQAWLNRGRVPERLFRDQTFNMSTTTRFKMNLECGLVVGNTCGLENPAGHQVPVNMLVSLPNGLTDSTGQAVSRLPLRVDGSGTELFQPGFYVNRKPGKLHFEVQKSDVTQMLEYPDTRYRGTVTVVWDSEV